MFSKSKTPNLLAVSTNAKKVPFTPPQTEANTKKRRRKSPPLTSGWTWTTSTTKNRQLYGGVTLRGGAESLWAATMDLHKYDGKCALV